jgi:chromosome segregation ATPase
VAAEPKEQQLAELDRQIAERKKYYRDQEALINDLVESGNTRLMGLTYEITAGEQELKNLKTDIRLAKQDKQLLDEDLQAMRAEASDMAGDFSPVMA